jgi:hypothetical protein
VGRNGTVSPEGMHGTDDRPSAKVLLRPRWPSGVKGAALAVTVLALLGVVAFGVVREGTTTGRAPIAEVSRPAGSTAHGPALTRAEEAYIQALWPIHAEVERSTVRLSLGKIFYKVNELGKADLRARVDAALATYRQAEARIGALQPPPSLERAHHDYLAAVELFEKSALEVLKMFDDGDDEHLLAAYPLSKEGSDKIREIGVRFWQDEYPPN